MTMANARMAEDSAPHWDAYLTAVRRKIDIAIYHLNRLATELALSNPPAVPTPVQAHFEGILYSFVAVEDQLAEGLRSAYSTNARHRRLRDAVGRMPESEMRRRLSIWNDAKLVADVHAIRVRATHHHYEKDPHGGHWVVEEPTRVPPYGGSREILAYGEAAVTHLRQLEPEIDNLAAIIRLAASRAAQVG